MIGRRLLNILGALLLCDAVIYRPLVRPRVRASLGIYSNAQIDEILREGVN